MTSQSSVFPLFVTLVVGLAGCAHAPTTSELKSDPRGLLSRTCEIGRKNERVTGSVWLKAQSKEASGQFPASVNAEARGSLRLEVTNLVGGPEALIEVKDSQYTIKATSKKPRVQDQKGFGSWGGIPLNWASELFLGRIPCPAAGEIQDAAVSANDEGELVVETKPSLRGAGEKFVYRFRPWGGVSWPESLHWERVAKPPVAVDFKFDDPEDRTSSPRKWEAKSARGDVKVRWRERNVSP